MNQKKPEVNQPASQIKPNQIKPIKAKKNRITLNKTKNKNNKTSSYLISAAMFFLKQNKNKTNLENGTVCYKDAVFIENQIIVSIDIKPP